MGTNFYMFTNKRELKPMLGDKAILTDDPEFGYEIHIAKTSAGWQPYFEAHEHIRSVADLKLLYDQGDVSILDEYGTEYNWAGFVERVVKFGDKQNWRTSTDYCNEFTSIDGYRFCTREFS